jgi:hypothetical protein
MSFSNPKQIGITIQGSDIIFPFTADVTGTWKIVYSDGSSDTFSATSGETLTKANDFATDTDIIFQLWRPNNTIFNQTAYLVNYGYETTTTTARPVTYVGKIYFTVSTQTAGYVNDDLKNVVLYLLFIDKELEEALGETFDETTGTFTWTLAAGKKVTILYYK